MHKYQNCSNTQTLDTTEKERRNEDNWMAVHCYNFLIKKLIHRLSTFCFNDWSLTFINNNSYTMFEI